ncbi:hypothetical protein AC579_5543 [Pseudocercospora musae]|uniref:Uncharacterized protein n=1 Tax=Pseudocercospora musae TaxID=113226 RepID=A0A139I185_9PEZI|nr:hypothetical protein AC579_5543 [Pseudocercospora musae]
MSHGYSRALREPPAVHVASKQVVKMVVARRLIVIENVVEKCPEMLCARAKFASDKELGEAWVPIDEAPAAVPPTRNSGSENNRDSAQEDSSSPSKSSLRAPRLARWERTKALPRTMLLCAKKDSFTTTFTPASQGARLYQDANGNPPCLEPAPTYPTPRCRESDLLVLSNAALRTSMSLVSRNRSSAALRKALSMASPEERGSDVLLF